MNIALQCALVYTRYMRRKEILLLLTILALGAFLRFYHITSIPPGLYPDEAVNGNNALEAIYTGNFKIFYPDNNGREGLFINIQAISVWLFDREPWALRILSAIFGTLTIFGIYFATKELLQKNKIALLAAFFTATSYWHLNFSRIGFRAITAPFFLSFGLYFLLRGFRRNSVWDMVWAGVFTGLGFQGYIAFRFVPFIIAVPILWQLTRWWHARSKPKTACTPCAVALFLFITFVTALPIGWYFLKHPTDFTGRSKDVSILSVPSPVLEFIKTNALTLGMLFVRGDCNDRHNYACRSELNPLVAFFFVIGLIAAIKGLFRNSDLGFRNSTLLAWLAFMSLPATLTREGMPHALRSIGMIPPVMILSGLGAYIVFDFLQKHTSRKTASVLMAIVLLYVTAQTYYDYFIAWAARPQTANAFSQDLWHLGQYLETTPRDIKKYVIVDLKGDQNGGLPVVAQTIAFTTDTFRQEGRLEKNLTYILSKNALLDIQIPEGQQTIVAPLQKNDPEMIGIIHEKFPGFREVRFDDFLIFQNF